MFTVVGQVLGHHHPLCLPPPVIAHHLSTLQAGAHSGVSGVTPILGHHHHSTQWHYPPHEQILMRLEVGTAVEGEMGCFSAWVSQAAAVAALYSVLVGVGRVIGTGWWPLTSFFALVLGIIGISGHNGVILF